jgi:hypothetical protein
MREGRRARLSLGSGTVDGGWKERGSEGDRGVSGGGLDWDAWRWFGNWRGEGMRRLAERLGDGVW